MTPEEARRHILRALESAPYGERTAIAEKLASEFGRHRSWIYRQAVKAGLDLAKRKEPTEEQINIALELRKTPHREKAELVKKIAKEKGKTERWVYFQAARGGERYGWHKSRRHINIDKDTLLTIAQMIHGSKRKGRRMVMGVEDAVEILQNHGAEITLGVRQIQRLLHRLRLSRRQMQDAIDNSPHVRLASLHPNHVHQFDISPAIKWYFSKTGRLSDRDTKTDFYIKKPNSFKKIRRHILRFILVDHFTGAAYVRYFYEAGERAVDVVRFWWEAWADKEEVFGYHWKDYLGKPRQPGPHKFPFRGIPELLILDKGSAGMANMAQSFLDGLGVPSDPHLPGNPRAKGSVEGFMNIWEQKFESRLRLYPCETLEDLNRLALIYCVYFNASKIHHRHGRTRMALWSTIRSEHLKVPPSWEICRRLAHSKPIEKRVKKDGTFRFGGRLYFLGDTDIWGAVGQVRHNPWEHPAVDFLYQGQIWKAVPLAVNEAGFPENAVVYGEYRQPKHTRTQKQIAQFKGRPLPEFSREADLEALAERAEPYEHIKRPGDLLEVPDDRAGALVSRTQAMSQAADELGRNITPAEYQRICDEFPEQVTEAQIKQMVDFLAAQEEAEAAVGI